MMYPTKYETRVYRSSIVHKGHKKWHNRMYIISKTHCSVLCICIIISFETRCQNSIHIYLNTCGVKCSSRIKLLPYFSLFTLVAAGVLNRLSTPEGTQTHVPSTFYLYFVQIRVLKAWQLMSHDTLFNNNRISEINLMNREMFKHCFNDQIIRSRPMKLEFFFIDKQHFIWFNFTSSVKLQQSVYCSVQN